MTKDPGMRDDRVRGRRTGPLWTSCLQRELTRTLLGPNHRSLRVLIRMQECRSMPIRPRIVAYANRSFVRVGGCGRV